MTFKSLHEALDAWAIKELVGHYVNYRKQVSHPESELLPEEHFQLFAVATRFLDKLAKQVSLVRVGPGNYRLQWGVDSIRVIVLSEITLADHNLILNLFSSKIEGPKFAWDHLGSKQPNFSGIINQIFELHFQSRLDVPYTKQDFVRDYVLEHLDLLKPEERLKGLPAETLLRDLPTEERLRGLPTNERLNGISLDEIENYARQLREQQSSQKLKDSTSTIKAKRRK